LCKCQFLRWNRKWFWREIWNHPVRSWINPFLRNISPWHGFVAVLRVSCWSWMFQNLIIKHMKDPYFFITFKKKPGWICMEFFVLQLYSIKLYIFSLRPFTGSTILTWSWGRLRHASQISKICTSQISKNFFFHRYSNYLAHQNFSFVIWLNSYTTAHIYEGGALSYCYVT